ncbi:MAG: carbon-monoxide dehydrogenase large subunit [Gammaproteobacteria bacterium]
MSVYGILGHRDGDTAGCESDARGAVMAGFIGTSVKRLEDPALLTGNGQFIDDLHIAGTLHAAFVRSAYAHARITGVNVEQAKSLPGVHAIYTFDDLPQSLRQAPMPLLVPRAGIRNVRTPWALVKDEVCHVGEPIAVVLAEDRYIAEDAVEQVIVDYEPLPVCADVATALASDAAMGHSDIEDNLAGRMTHEFGDVDAAFAAADTVVSAHLFQHRSGGHAIECRTLLAQYDPTGENVTIWAGTQSPHQYRDAYALAMGRDQHQVRVIAPDVGGGFGPKTVLYPEQFVIPACALLSGRAVKWIEDRREHFLTTYQERDQYWDGELALNSDGKILALRGHLLHDADAYLPWGMVVPHICAATVPGPYVMPAYRMDVDVDVVFTNKVPVTLVRGAGRPQAVFFMERLMDKAAAALAIAPDELRRRNFVQPEQMPYAVGLVFRGGNAVTYDRGDYPQCQRLALDRADWSGFPARQHAAHEAGRFLGIATASYVEGTGLGPFEGVNVRVQRDGKVLLTTGAAAQGQGHATMLAQVCADALGVTPDDIRVKAADTAAISYGVGTFASRIAANAAPAAHIAGGKVREKVLKAVAHMLEASEADLELANGRVFVRGIPEHGKTLAEMADFANGFPGFAMPKDIEAGLEDTHYFTPKRASYPNGCHVVEVEVDTETGQVHLLNYVTGHDCGTIINPLSVEGQVQGGVAHGIGNALFEWMRYDENAQPTTVNFGEYLLPSAPEVPTVKQVHLECPSPLNPLGVKGAGEGGTIPVTAVIAAAVENALAPFGVQIDQVPITPDWLLEQIDTTRAKSE